MELVLLRSEKTIGQEAHTRSETAVAHTCLKPVVMVPLLEKGQYCKAMLEGSLCPVCWLAVIWRLLLSSVLLCVLFVCVCVLLCVCVLFFFFAGRCCLESARHSGKPNKQEQGGAQRRTKDEKGKMKKKKKNGHKNITKAAAPFGANRRWYSQPFLQALLF